MNSLRFLIVVIWAGSLLGCGDPEKVSKVHFKIPIGFSGPFAVFPDTKGGAPLESMQPIYELRIPDSGVLKIAGFDPFSSYTASATFADGQQIRVDPDRSDESVAIWSMPTFVFQENSRWINSYWWFVGTEKEWKGFKKGGYKYEPGSVRKVRAKE